MKFKCKSGTLLNSLNKLSSAVSNNPIIPVLENVKFQANVGLSLTATDLELTIQTDIDDVQVEEKGEICIPFRILVDTLKTLPDEEVDISTDGLNIKIKSNTGTYKFVGEFSDDFPDVPEVDGEFFEISPRFDKCLFATCQDSLRPAMTGVYFAGNEVVATDGHRLVRIDTDPIDGNFILPRNTCAAIKDATRFKMSCNDTQAKIEIGDMKYTSRLIDSKFPDYKAILPKDNDKKMVVNRSELLMSVKRAGIYSNHSTNAVVFSMKENVLTIHGEDKDFSNECTEQIPCSFSGEFRIGLNSKFLAEMLSIIGGESVTFEFSEPNRAAIIKGDVEMLIMPIIIKN